MCTIQCVETEKHEDYLDKNKCKVSSYIHFYTILKLALSVRDFSPSALLLLHCRVAKKEAKPSIKGLSPLFCHAVTAGDVNTFPYVLLIVV